MIQDIVTAYIQYAANIKHFSRHTITAYQMDMQLFIEWLSENALDFAALEHTDLHIFTAELRDKHFAPASVNRILSCIRGFYRYAIRFGHCTANPAAAVRNIKQPQKLPRFLFPEEAEQLCAFPQKAGILWHARDEALFASLYSTGCRISELLGLTLQDMNKGYTAAIVYGKGKKERTVFFADFAQKALQEYLPERQALLQRFGKTAASLFLNWKGESLTPGGVRYIINRYTAILPQSKKLSPHAFRHSFASLFVTRGADMRVVQELLGHSSIATTQRYTHITAAQLQALYHKAHPHG